MTHGDNRPARNVDAIHKTGIDAPGKTPVTGTAIGIFTDPAWTERFAGAHFQQATFDLISHCIPP
jgi:hypothetical protein